MKELFMIGVGAAFINNVVLSQFLGICAFLGVSKKTGTAAGMGAAVVFVITLSSLITGVLYRFILVPLNVEYLQTIVFILIIAALVQFVEMALKKYSHALYEALGVYLPLITTNCAVLGVALINVQRNYSILEGVVHGGRFLHCHRAHGWYPGKNRGQRYSGVLQGYAHRASDSLPDGHCIFRLFRA